jgi:hypothetical protein
MGILNPNPRNRRSNHPQQLIKKYVLRPAVLANGEERTSAPKIDHFLV